jgi:hypothetical protein
LGTCDLCLSDEVDLERTQHKRDAIVFGPTNRITAAVCEDTVVRHDVLCRRFAGLVKQRCVMRAAVLLAFRRSKADDPSRRDFLDRSAAAPESKLRVRVPDGCADLDVLRCAVANRSVYLRHLRVSISTPHHDTPITRRNVVF